MFWADKIADEIIKSGKYKPYWVDDMKTPSGRVHVGALMGVVIHDLIYRALKDRGQEATYTYVFENHDPMDDIPSYLDRAKYEQYLGMPLFKIPSPVEGYDNFAAYYAADFEKTFTAIGSHPKVLWTKDLYTSGKMNSGIKTVLDNAEEVRKIYEEMYKKPVAKDWYPFQVYCEQCGKVSTTKVYNWDGEFVYYRCSDIDWTTGCGYEGKTSPFSSESGMKGKMPWKVEWPAKWQAIGVTIEGAGKDHMSAGGSHDLATLVATRVLKYPVPYPIAYEWILIGGRKMSSSKGVGVAASDMLKILPPELVRFLIVKMNIFQQTNFDPALSETIPHLFDDYQKYAEHYFTGKKDDYARIFELSQIDEVKKPPTISFGELVGLIKKNDHESIKKANAESWVKYATYWLENFAPEEEKVQNIAKEVPEEAKILSDKQKEFLRVLAQYLDNQQTSEEMQQFVFETAKSVELSGKDAFSAIYLSLYGKTQGPKAGALLFQNREIAKKRFGEVSS